MTVLYTILALLAFAANSLLCRLALAGVSIDPASFTLVRLVSGAAMLFGAVQVTMLLGGFRSGHRPAPGQWLGLAVAFGGLVYLVFPGLTAPSPIGAGLMLLAGLSWGLYSLKGRTATDPLAQTAGSFARTIPMAAVLCLAFLPSLRF